MTEREEIERLAKDIESYHGCLTGDCPHHTQNECLAELFRHSIQAGRESMRAEINDKCEKLLAESVALVGAEAMKDIEKWWSK